MNKVKDQILKMIFRKIGDLTNKAQSLNQLKISFDHVESNLYWDACNELIKEGLLAQRRNDYVVFTPDGLDSVEELIKPKQNILNSSISIDTAINSPIQLGTNSEMKQSINYSSVNNDDLKRLVQIFEEHIQELDLKESDNRKANAQLATIKAQLIDEPDPTIINQAGKSLRNITEGAIGSVIASATQPEVWGIVQKILACFP